MAENLWKLQLLDGWWLRRGDLDRLRTAVGDLRNPMKALLALPGIGDIQLEAVTFGYDRGMPVLDGVEATFARGEPRRVEFTARLPVEPSG